MKSPVVCLTFFLLLSSFLYSAVIVAHQATSATSSASPSPSPSTSPTLADIVTRLDALDRKIKEQNSWSNPSILLPFISAMMVALFGGGVALYTLLTQKRAGMKRMLLESLKWFEGGIQKRGIGVAIINGNWEEFEDLRATWISVLVSQAVYILSKSYEIEDRKPKFLPEHEFLNLERILALLKKGLSETDNKLLSGDPITEINDAFTKAIDIHKSEAPKPSNEAFIQKINTSKKRIEDIKATF